MQTRDGFAQDLAPHQFAVGVQGGCEVVQKCIEVCVHEDPTYLVVALDVHNAYNAIFRGTCLRSLAECRPELAAFAHLFYHRSSHYVFRGADGSRHTITADEGVEQGDAFAPALFVYGLRPAIVRAQHILDDYCKQQGTSPVILLAYLDDIVVLAPASVAECAFEVLQEELSHQCDSD